MSVTASRFLIHSASSDVAIKSCYKYLSYSYLHTSKLHTSKVGKDCLLPLGRLFIPHMISIATMYYTNNYYST